MPVSIAASERAIHDPSPIDISDASFVPDVELRIPVGVNLTLLGASQTDVPGEDSPEPFLSRVNIPLLASSVGAAQQGGVDLITLDRDFHIKAARPPRSGALDGVHMAAKLGLGQELRMCAEVPSDPSCIREAVRELAMTQLTGVALMITLQELDDYQDYVKAAAEARAAGVELWLLATNPDFTAAHADVVVQIFDAVRVRTTDRHRARAMRFALHEAAAKVRRTMTAFADIGIVISATVQAAEERAILISQLNGTELFQDMASAVGTVYDVADLIESWVGLGAADGVVLTPASLPTDLASVLKGVLPLLEARATIERNDPRS
ncbi:MAG: hypothetical protein PUK59_01050 [Actinomycetaceae bacterium]|nr:hypothetical protein [Actinomycetaceae bacterium]MDY5854664.1 hypothetical protein [Arcanobacterium sp.]